MRKEHIPSIRYESGLVTAYCHVEQLVYAAALMRDYLRFLRKETPRAAVTVADELSDVVDALQSEIARTKTWGGK
jgi:hypothetical protein